MQELEQWKHESPLFPPSSSLPRTHDDDLESVFLLASLTLCSPALRQDIVEMDLLQKCAAFAVKGCETAIGRCLSSNHKATPIQAYICFTFGITLLWSLTKDTSVLPLSRVTRALSSCSSALAIYSRTLRSADPFLKVFDTVCDRYFGVAEGRTSSYAALGTLLQHLSSCGPERVEE